MGKVVELGTCMVCESNRKKTALIRAVSRHWRVVTIRMKISGKAIFSGKLKSRERKFKHVYSQSSKSY